MIALQVLLYEVRPGVVMVHCVGGSVNTLEGHATPEEVERAKIITAKLEEAKQEMRDRGGKIVELRPHTEIERHLHPEAKNRD